MATKIKNSKKNKSVKVSPNQLIAIDDGRGRMFIFRSADQKAVLKELKEAECTEQEQLEDYDVVAAHPTNKYICVEYRASARAS